MIALEQTADGVVIPVRVHAAARRNAVVGVHAGALRVDVVMAPEKGKANAAVMRVIQGVLDVPKSAIELLSGATSPQKRLLVAGLTLEQVNERLSAVLT